MKNDKTTKKLNERGRIIDREKESMRDETKSKETNQVKRNPISIRSIL